MQKIILIIIYNSNYNLIIFVYIGLEVKSFGIYKELLFKASIFLRGIFSNEYKPEIKTKSEDGIEIILYNNSSKVIIFFNKNLLIFK